jgi:hypothetical protein
VNGGAAGDRLVGIDTGADGPCPKNSLTRSPPIGIRVLPPTKTTPAMAFGESCVAFKTRDSVSNIHGNGSDGFSDRLIQLFFCLQLQC